MRLENIVLDARDPGRLGRFWAEALGARVTVDEPGYVEARLDLADDVFLDLCMERVAELPTFPARLHLDLLGDDRQAEIVDRVVGLGARHVDIGQGAVPWVVLADPEDNAFCVMEHRDAYADTGPIAALPLDSAEPARDAAFWAAITGWIPVDGVAAASLRHPSGAGPLLELCPEPEAKRGKNRIHLDVRPAPEEVDVLSVVRRMGGRTLDWPGSGGKPWTVCADPSGNEFCLLSPG